MTSTRTRALLLLAVTAIAFIAVGCRSTPDVVLWGPCTPGNDPTGTDGRWSMVCTDSEWTPVMTVDEFVRINRGEPNVKIEPLPKRPAPKPAPTTTVRPPVTPTTVAPTTTTTTTIPVPVPTITSVAPSAGSVNGGTSVTITGTNFAGVSAVTFDGDEAEFTLNSATSITAVTPAGGAGIVDVAVITPADTVTSRNAYTYIAVPTITSVSPDEGSVNGGTSVTITGTNFAGASAVTFGTTSAVSFTLNSATSITATTPAGSAGAVDVVVRTAGGNATLPGSYTYN